MLINLKAGLIHLYHCCMRDIYLCLHHVDIFLCPEQEAEGRENRDRGLRGLQIYILNHKPDSEPKEVL